MAIMHGGTYAECGIHTVLLTKAIILGHRSYRVLYYVCKVANCVHLIQLI